MYSYNDSNSLFNNNKTAMRKLLFILSLCIYCNLIAQDKKQVSLIDITNYDKVYHKTIDNKYPITIYLKNSIPHIRKDDITHRYCTVKGWYWYDKFKVRIPLIGIYTPITFNNYNTLSLYVTEKESSIENLSINDQKDWFSLIEKLDHKETFKFLHDKTEGEWSDGKTTLSIDNINFGELPIQNKIYLSIEDNTKKEYIDLFNILELNDFEFAGLNGYAYNTIKLIEYTVVENGINILLDALFENTIRCWGSTSGYYSIELDENNAVKNINYVTTYSCDNFAAVLDKNNSNSSEKRYNVTVDKIDNNDIIGVYSVTDSKITIEKEWR